MRILSVTIHGFKSFADTTTIDLQSDITAVVGPNGCGKSNVVEAVLWTLGEQSAKELRGMKMDDVIFSGAKERKSAQHAEVKILFDNDDGYLPLGYRQVEVARKLFRTGESEYTINKNIVRLKDVQELFSSSGLSKTSFAIIGQGKIDEFIRQAPQERRRMIDEVSGVAKFFIKKKEASRRLDASEIHLDRLRDILQEVTQQLEKLDIQANMAEEWHIKTQRMLQKKYAVALLAYETAEKKCAILEKAPITFEQEIQLLKRAMGEKEQEKARLTEALFVQEKSYNRSLEKQHSIHLQKTVYESELKRIDGVENGFKERARAICQSIEELQKKTLQDKKELEISVQSVALVAKEKEDETEKREEDVEELATKEKAFQELQKALNSLVEVYSSALSSQKSTKMERDFLLLEREKKKSESRKLEKKVEELKIEYQRLIREKQHLSKESIQILKDEIGEKQKAFALIEKESIQDEATCTTLEELVGEKKKSVQSIEAERAARRSLLERLSHDPGAIQSVLGKIRFEKESRPALLVEYIKPFLVNAPSSLIRFLDRYYSDTVVVESLRELSLLKNELPSISKISSFSSLVLEHIECCRTSTNRPQALFQYILSMCTELAIKFDELTVFERASSICLAEEFEIDSLGVYRVYLPSKKGALSQPLLGMFTLEKEISSLDKAYDKALKEQEELSKKHITSKASLQRLFQEKNMLNESMRKLDMTLVERTFQLTQFQEKKSHFETLIKECEKDLEAVTPFCQDVEVKIAELSALFENQQKIGEKYLQEKIEQESALKQFEKELQIYKTRIFEHTRIIEECDRRLLLSKNQELRYQTLLKERQEYEEELHKEQKSIKVSEDLLLVERQQIVLEQESILTSLELGQKELEIQSQLVVEKKAEYQKLEEALRLQLKQLDKLQERLQKAIQEASQEQASLQVALQDKNRIFHEIENSYPNLIQNLSSIVVSKNVQNVLDEIAQELHWLNANKDMNFHAIEEQQKTRLRRDTIVKELRDLEESKASILCLIEDLEIESRKEFMAVFEAIRTQFKENFQLLFGGGEADLLLIGAEALSDAGVELKASPPGKEMRSLQLLSGGERCLTSIALLFALFQVKNAPLCLLDEIDAPLDEANVARFHTLLQKSASLGTQFVIVTHNRRTMTIADRLIGVSMHQKGVSCIVGVDLGVRQS